MKRILFITAIVALIFGATPRAKAQSEVSIDFFYDNLAADGNWLEVGDYGYCFQPNVAASDRNWRPYADGYWAYTDVGWTWVSYENFGWATYHYGRWARLHDLGWVWVPGTEWGPAWVSWRTGGDHVGWAPLPPRRVGGEPVYEGRPIGGQADLEFDIGPEYYNFIDVRFIGDPVLSRHIVDRRENITYIDNTVNVTNITYKNSIVYNGGPDYNRLSAYSTRKIPRLELRRETNVDLRGAVRSNSLTKVQGNQLVIAAPLKMERGSQTPKIIKTKVEKPKIETGWAGISDQKKKAELQAKFKTEDAKSVPSPKTQPIHPEELKATDQSISPAASATPEVSAAPLRKREDDLSMPLNTRTPAPSPNETKTGGKERGVKPQSSPALTPTASPTIFPDENKMKGQGRRQPKSLPTIVPRLESSSIEGGAATTTTPNEFKERGRHSVVPLNTPAVAAAPKGEGESSPRMTNEFKAKRGLEAATAPPTPVNERKVQPREENSQNRESGNEKEKNTRGKKNEQVPSPSPGQ